MNLKKVRGELWQRYYYLMMILYLISVFITNLKVGFILSCVMIILIRDIVTRKIQKSDTIILVYALFCLLSFGWMVGDHRLSNFLTEATYMILPMCFYFYAKKVSDVTTKDFLNNTVNSLFIAMIIGSFFYFIAPPFYGHFLVNKGYSSNYLKGWIQASFQGIFGVTCNGSFCAILAAHELISVLAGEKKRVPFFLVSLIWLAMTARKSALFAVGVVFIVCSFYGFRKKSVIQRVLFVILVCAGCFVIFGAWFPQYYAIVMARFGDFKDAFNERQISGFTALQNVQGLIWGNGFGSSGHIAGENGANYVVNDNSYLLILCETGIIGLGLFLLLLIQTLYRGCKKIKSVYFEMSVIIILLLQGIGSNIFEFQQLMPLFWFCMGRCNRQSMHLSQKDTYMEEVEN